MNTLTQKLSSVLFPVITGVALLASGCGGVDPDPDPGTDPDLTTTTACMQDSWTRVNVGSGGGKVELTYEFLEDGTFIQRSYVDNISTYEYLNGIENSDYDMEVLPGISVDLFMLLGIVGPFYIEGYFYTEGRWALDEATGVATLSMPQDRAFGHSIWSESGAERDFDRSYSVDSMALKATDQYAYCTGEKLVVGAFRKDDDSDIAGLWSNLKDDFYVASDYAGASYRLRLEDGSLYSRRPFQMELNTDGYALGSCFWDGVPEANTEGFKARYFLLDNRAGASVSRSDVEVTDVDTVTTYSEMLSDEYLYRLIDGGLKRVNLETAAETLLATFESSAQIAHFLKTETGIVAVVQRDSGSLLIDIDDSNDDGNDEFASFALSSSASAPRLYAYLSGFLIEETGSAMRHWQYTPATDALVSIAAGTTAAAAGESRLLVHAGKAYSRRADTSGQTRLWVLNDVQKQFEPLVTLTDGLETMAMVGGDGGIDFYRRSWQENTASVAHLNTADLTVSFYQSWSDIWDVDPSGANDSRFYITGLNPADSNDRQLRVVNAVNGTDTLISPESPEIYVPAYLNHGHRIVYESTPLVYGEDEVISLVVNGDSAEAQRIHFGNMSQYQAAGLTQSAGESSAFYARYYTPEGQQVNTLYLAQSRTSPFSLWSQEYSFGHDSAAFGDDFIVSDNHLIAPARDEYSGRELLVLNTAGTGFDFINLHPVPDASSAVTLVGSMGDRTVLKGWDETNSCRTPEGRLKFEGGFLWYENGTRGFAGTQWFTRS